jgi:hypothetical protein
MSCGGAGGPAEKLPRLHETGQNETNENRGDGAGDIFAFSQTRGSHGAGRAG